MVYSYEDLVKKKEQGEVLNFDDITKEQLEKLFIYDNIPNSMIADLYDVEPSKVKYRRQKWNISMYSAKYTYNLMKNQDSDLFENLNKNSLKRLTGEENIERISKALTHYLFRNGPVEDMHANGQLSQSDMKTLNKYMVNRIAGLLKLMNDGEWLTVELIIESLRYFGTGWDKVEYDLKTVDILLEHMN